MAFKPLTMPRLKASILASLRDARCQNWKDSLMRVIQTSLCHCSIYFNVFPNLILSLTDRNIYESVSLNIQTHGYEFLPESETIVVIYRIRYKLMNTLCPNTIIRSNPGKTLVIESNLLTTNVAIPRLIDREEIIFPTNETISQVVEPQPIINNKVDQIIQTPGGEIEISFSLKNTRRISLSRSLSSRSNISSYRVDMSSSSKYSISEKLVFENNFEESNIEGIKISEQQIPHGIYSQFSNSQYETGESSQDYKRESPTVSEMNFKL